MSLFGYAKKIRPQKDVAKLRTGVKEIAIKGDAKNVASLGGLHALKKVYIVTVTQRQFDAMAPYLMHIAELKMYEVRCTDLSAIGGMTSLEKLDLEWNTKIEQLWDMQRLKSLKKLRISDFSKLHDVSSIAHMSLLEDLELSGGMWNRLTLDSVKPLSGLLKLKKLDLGNVAIKDPASIAPLETLVALEELNMAMRFPTEEIARLSVKLANTSCEWFAPYVKIQLGDDKDIMIVGKGKPRLSSKKDAARIEKYAYEFEALQEKYR